MASVNRYTKIAPARYTPRTLQEMMITPGYKRQQHDTLDEQLSATETALAQVDPLDVHSERAKAEQQKLYDQLSKQAEQLGSEGFTPTSKSDFTRLNKQYQQAIGPTGTLGKIQSAKKAAEVEKADILANAVKMGYSPEAVQRQIQNSFDKYTQDFEDTGEIVNFKGDLPPSYQDLDKDIKDIKVMAGSTVRTRRGKEGYNIITDPTTQQLVAITESGQVITEDNKDQLGEALKHLNSKWISPEGEGFASAEYEGLSPAYIQQRINSGLGIMKESKVQDTRNKNYKFMSNPAAQYNQEGRLMDFVVDKIKGFNINKLDPNSLLIGSDRIESANFDENGNIPKNTKLNPYSTYKEKVDIYKEDFQNIVSYDKDRDIYTVGRYNPKFDKVITVDIPKDLNHYKSQIDSLRSKNPFLSEMNDKQIMETLQEYKQNITSTYVDAIDLIDSDYEWLNDKYFGSEKGSGEKASGTVSREGATIDGRQLTADKVYSSLGYSTDAEFKEKGKPAIQGYVPALGKFRASVLDSEGVSTDIFIDGTSQLQSLTSTSQQISEDMLKGKSFSNLGAHRSNPDYNIYMVNDFTGNPYVVFSKQKNVTNPTDLIDLKTIGAQPRLKREEDQLYRYSEVSGIEKQSVLQSPHFKKLAGQKVKN